MKKNSIIRAFSNRDSLVTQLGRINERLLQLQHAKEVIDYTQNILTPVPAAHMSNYLF